MEGAPRPLFCNGLEGKRTFQKDLVKVENIAKTKKTVTFTATCAHPLKEGHQEATVATPLPWKNKGAVKEPTRSTAVVGCQRARPSN